MINTFSILLGNLSTDMADIRAFRGFRYDLGRAGTLTDLVAPPYDVVDSKLQDELYNRSPFNAIRLELTKGEEGDTDNNNRYTRASQTLSGWLNDNIVQQDTLRCLYVIEQEFTAEGKTYKRRGFMARVRLEEFGKGQIYAHEETMSGPKADRLKLFQATNMNLSPIFGLYPDSSNDVFGRLEHLLLKSLPLEATDHLGVISRLWTITDEKVLSSVASGMTDKAIFIADGHHRYETSCKYLAEAKAGGQVANDESPANFTMMFLVSMSDPGLIILPTHRLVSGLSGLTAEQLQQTLSPHFTFEKVASATEAWENIEMDGSQGFLGLYTKADGVWQTARFKNPELMAKLATDHSEEWQGLGVSILQRAILDTLLPGANVKDHCRFVHLLKEVEDDSAAKGCDLAVLVPPATMDHVEHIAGNLEKMPPKSTYFYPKLLTGLVFNSLKTN
jgi:uncharacterized protein (DUF1015 family)